MESLQPLLRRAVMCPLRSAQASNKVDVHALTTFTGVRLCALAKCQLFLLLLAGLCLGELHSRGMAG